jgi:hypothetical protein
MMKRKAPEPATSSAARRSERAENDNDAAAAETGVTALGAADAEAAAQQSPALVAELESVWHTIGRALGVSWAMLTRLLDRRRCFAGLALRGAATAR